MKTILPSSMGMRWLILVVLSTTRALPRGGVAWGAESAGLGLMEGGSYSHANAVSADGLVVVGYADHRVDALTFYNREAFRWTVDSGMVGLGLLPGDDWSWGLAVSEDGTVVVGQSGNGNSDAFRWTADARMVGLVDFGGSMSCSNGVSADGTVVVGVSNSSWYDMKEPFRWTANCGMIGLDRGVQVFGACKVWGA